MEKETVIDKSPKEYDSSLPDISPYITPDPNKIYKCKICFDYGGVIDNNLPIINGLPQGRTCDCQLEDNFL